MQSDHGAIVPIGDTRLWITTSGAGDPLVLTNGGAGCCDYLGLVATMIEDLGQVVRWEARGCGRSATDDPTRYDLLTTVRDLDTIRAHLGFERWIVGGHSHGALISLVYALEYPERTRGILYIAGAGIQNDRSWSEAYHRGKDEGRERELDYTFPANMEVNRVGNLSARAYFRQPDILRRIADLRAPMVAIQAGGDIRPNWPAEQVVRLMPDARLETIPDADHNLWLTHPNELRAALRDAVISLMETP
ncbi:MAG: alpha/beta hydrolase [Thermomicrobiales bacterium]